MVISLGYRALELESFRAYVPCGSIEQRKYLRHSLQEKNGGAIKVEEGATATFKGTGDFYDNSIQSTLLESVSCGSGCYTPPGIRHKGARCTTRCGLYVWKLGNFNYYIKLIGLICYSP